MTQLDDEMESCYYHGTVLNDDESHLALSLCQKEGIRGRINAFGEVLFIKPKSYYFDPHSAANLTDEHLVHKATDFDWEEDEIYGLLYDDTKEDEMDINTLNSNTIPTIPSLRRRMRSTGTVEITFLIDKTWVDYKGSVSSTKSYFSGVLNDASDWYNQLPSDIKLKLKWGYAVFDKFSHQDSKACQDWTHTDHDYCFLWQISNDGTGRGSVGGICKSSRSYGGYWISKDSKIRVGFPHELGHNLMQSGCMQYAKPGGKKNHDPPDTCFIMSPKSCNGGWSSRTKECFRDNIKKWDCLYQNEMSNFKMDDKLGGSSVDSGVRGGGSDSDCIKLSNFRGSLSTLNGKWSSDGKSSGYKQDGSSKTLRRISDSGTKYWAVNNQWKYGWCAEKSITSCSDSWEGYDGNEKGTIKKTSSCSGALHFDTVCEDGYGDRLCFDDDEHELRLVFDRIKNGECDNKAAYLDEDNIISLYYEHDTEWILSDGDISNETHVEYWCYKKDLNDCTEGKWNKIYIDMDVEYEAVVQNAMIRGCGLEKKTALTSANINTIIISAVLSLVLLAVCIFVVVFYCWKRKELEKSMVDEESDDEASDDEVVIMNTTPTTTEN
eukprot:217537_1